MINDREALQDALKETLEEHGLRLVEVTWKTNLEKRTVALGLKVTGDLDKQMELLDGGNA